jgi:heterodisulfide reductase subunit B
VKPLVEYHFFPGCSLKQEARAFERSGLAVMEALGVRLIELERWNCCGTVFSLTQDDLMHQIGPVRNLIRTEQAGGKELVTLCSMCFNTIKRSKQFLEQDPERVDKLNAFMDEEPSYRGEVEVLHYLEILRDQIGWEVLSQRVVQPLSGVRIAPYYGCTLLRPSSVAIDEGDNPSILSSLIQSMDAEVIGFGFEEECCGSYQVTDQRELVVERAVRILGAARSAGADLMITSCPLCFYNLTETQPAIELARPDFQPLPVYYFTEVLAYAMGLELDPESQRSIEAITQTITELIP